MSAVYYYDSDMPGAPELSSADGAMITLIETCLSLGFGSVTVDALSITDEIATATVSTGHGFSMFGGADGKGPMVEISGATPAALNGHHRIASVISASQFTVPAPGQADGTATGTIAVKRAPAVWTKLYSGTNKAAFQMPGGSGAILRLDDAQTLTSSSSTLYCAHVRGYELMTDVDTGINPFPTYAQKAADTLVWPRATNSTPSARPWMLFADDRRLLFFPRWSDEGSNRAEPCLFGDLTSYRAADAGPCILSGVGGYSSTNHIGQYNEALVNQAATYRPWIAREASGLANPRAIYPIGIGDIGRPFGNTGYAVSPNPSDGAIHLRGPIEWIVPDDNDLRGYWPGLYYPLQAYPIDHGAVIAGAAGIEGRALMGVHIAGDNTTIEQLGQVFIDLEEWT